jgi:tetratricopeptide (TPR) repeat protein
MNYANVLIDLGRFAQAEELNRETLLIQERVLGLEHPDTLATRINLALSIAEQGRAEDAEVLYREALAVAERVLGQDHLYTLITRDNLAVVVREQDRPVEAEALHRDALVAAQRALGLAHPQSLAIQDGLALAIDAQGRSVEAEALFRETLVARQRVLGPAHPDTLGTRTNLAVALLAQGLPEAALSVIEDGFPHLPSALSLAEATPLDLGAYLGSAWEALADAASVRTFPAQGYLTYGSLDVALGDQSARREVADPAAAAVLREFQEARDELQRLRRAFLVSFEATFEVTEQARARTQADLRMAEARFQEVSARLERDFPALADLELPRAPSAQEVAELLEPGEGLLAYAATDEHLYAWLVTPEGVTWQRVEVTRAELAERAEYLRAALDIDPMVTPPSVAADCAVPLVDPGSGRELPSYAFDLCAAEELHELVLGGLDLSGIEELIVVPDGPLETLPFGLLVTGRAADGSPRWLIEDHAISTLPTTSSLRALRRHGTAEGDEDRLPFLGLAPVTFDASEPGSALRGPALADLPGTAQEVTFLSALLGAGPEGTVIGEGASEAYLRTLELDRYRVLSFATHGLLAGETAEQTGGEIREMSLLLRPGGGEDGILAASEAATLRLDADWVLLSGCNTAGGEDDGADGLSGLARAFFFAGARALLVTHWPIDDRVTPELMNDAIARSAGDPTIGRAQALRQAQLAMLSQPQFQHPVFWAPFSVVGENR